MSEESTGDVRDITLPRGNLGPVSDPLRLEAVHRSGLLNETPTQDFDRILGLAVRCLDASCAAFLVVSGDGFHCRGSAGLPESWSTIDPWPLDWPFLLESAFEGPLAVGSADAEAARLAELPEAPFHAYAGAPLRDPEGNRLGVLALWCERARSWTSEEIDLVLGFSRSLADLVAHRLEARRREEELKASAERLRLAVESGSDLLYEFDVQSGALRTVGSVDRLLGYAPGELPLHVDSRLRVLHPEDRERVEARVKAHLEADEPFFEEYRVVCKDGSVRHWSDRGRTLRNAQGRPTRWVGLINDITERKRGEEALQRSLEERDVILGILDTPVIAREPSGRIVFANRAAAAYLGFPDPEALMASGRAVLSDRFAVTDAGGHPVDPGDLPGLAALRGEARKGILLRLVDREKGSAAWSVVNSTPVADSQGRVRLSITAFHDITGLKQAHIELERGRDEWDAILHAMDCGVLVLDPQGRRLYANPAAARLHGCSSVEDLTAMGPEEFAARFEILDREDGGSVPPDRLPDVRALRGERVEEELVCFRNLANGEVSWTRVCAVPVFDQGGGVRMAILTLQDMTALQRAQNELARSRDELDVILRTMDSGCTAQDATGSLVFANRAAAALLGYGSPEELLRAGGKVMERFEIIDVAGEAYPLERLPGRRALRGRAVSGEVMGYREKSSREVRWSIVNGTPVPDGQGGVRMAINVFHDITALKRAEEALVESRRSLDLVFRNVSDMVALIEVEPGGGFRNIVANPAHLEHCRLAPESFPGSMPGAHLPAAEAERIAESLREVSRSGKPRTLESASVDAGGRPILLEALLSPILDGSGRCTHILSVAKDVTGRKRAEEANASHLRFLERTDAVARAGESALDSEKVLPAVLAKVLEVMDCRTVLLVHPADPDSPDFRIPFSASRDGEPLGDQRPPASATFRELARRVLGKDGPLALCAGADLPESRYWLEAFGADSILALALRPRAGKPWLFCLLRPPGAPSWTPEDEAVFRDIGTRISAALGNMLLYRDLRRSEEKYRTLFERSLDGVFRCAPDGTVLDANPALVELLGCASRAELVGDAQRQLLPAVGLENLPGRREPFIVELARKHGGKVWAEVIAQAIRRSDGEVVCYEGMVRNIDDRKRTEAALKENEEVLRQAQKMEAVGRLAGGVAHDFNNLLTAINGFGDLLLMEVAKDDPRRLHVEEIRKAGERAAGLTSQLLAFSRKQVLSPRLLDLGEVVAGMEPMLRRLIGENIDFSVEPAPDLPRVLVDPSQAEQIVLNLALNARDAMPTGGRLGIRTALRRRGNGPGPALLEAQAVDCVLLEVTDTGVGMDEETKARLFEPFFTTKDKDKGTGLGLSMVYGAVKQGNGSIEVETRRGHGTTFRVLLPAAASRKPERPDSSARGTETILLVEDEDAVRRLVRDVLRFNGYKVLEAPGGEKALEAAERHAGAIHLLLTDVVMGGMSGRELAERLRAERPDTRVLYMSGYTEDAIIRHGVLSSQTAFIGKPFTPLALAAKVREVLTAAEVEG